LLSEIVYNPIKSTGPAKLAFKRTGSYNQTYIGWISSDKKQMTGYYVSNGKEYPFYTFKK